MLRPRCRHSGTSAGTRLNACGRGVRGSYGRGEGATRLSAGSEVPPARPAPPGCTRSRPPRTPPIPDSRPRPSPLRAPSAAGRNGCGPRAGSQAPLPAHLMLLQHLAEAGVPLRDPPVELGDPHGRVSLRRPVGPKQARAPLRPPSGAPC